jgi:hypothetical protein
VAVISTDWDAETATQDRGSCGWRRRQHAEIARHRSCYSMRSKTPRTLAGCVLFAKNERQSRLFGAAADSTAGQLRSDVIGEAQGAVAESGGGWPAAVTLLHLLQGCFYRAQLSA